MMLIRKNNVQRSPDRKGNGFRKFRQEIPLYLLALPGVIALLLFSYFPMAGIILVFKDYNFRGGIFGSPWADPIYKNFRFFFNNLSTAMRSTGLTVMYNLLFFLIGTLFAVAIAIMLSEIKTKWFIKASQSLMFLPYFISWMVTGAILYALLNVDSGLLNQILTSLGKEPIDFYAKPQMWIVILTIANTWQSCGYTSIIYYGVLTGIDSSLYEAAKVDGATKLQSIFKMRFQVFLVPNIFRISVWHITEKPSMKSLWSVLQKPWNLSPIMWIL